MNGGGGGDDDDDAGCGGSGDDDVVLEKWTLLSRTHVELTFRIKQIRLRWRWQIFFFPCLRSYSEIKK